MEPKSTQLAVEVKATDRNFKHFAKSAVILIVVFVIASLSFIAWHSITTTDQLQKVINTQGKELSQIQYTQVQNHNDNVAQLTALTGLLQQQDAYNKCLVSLFTHHTFVPTSLLDSCKPIGSATASPAPKTSSGASTGQTPAKTAQNGSGGSNTGTTPQTCPSGDTGTPPNCVKPSTLVRLLHDIGL